MEAVRVFDSSLFGRYRQRSFRALLVATLALVSVQSASAQKPTTATPLRSLIEEAERNSPDIAAAEHGWRAATNVPKQASALPDTQLTVQQFSVGSPRPFAGYTNSEFGYIGFGASQQIPYPGKRKLRAEVASREADAVQADAESARRQVVDRVKAVYFHLAYLQQTLSVLQRNDKLLGDIEQVVESRYRVGQGNQQEVLKAQLQHTKILQEITMHHRDQGQQQAELKRLLSRPQESPDIVTEPLLQRAIPYTSSDLLQLARAQNPEIRSREERLQRAQSQVELSQKEFRPDFNVQYMYQNTDRKFRDYYMATFGINLPNRGRRKAELAESKEKQLQADQELRSQIQKQFAEIQGRFILANTSAEQLKIFKEGLIPQAEATFRSALAAYQANRQDFQTLLSSFMDVLNHEVDYQRELAEHESALARIEALTGVTFQ